MNKTVRNILIRVSMFIGLVGFIFLMVMAKSNRDETKVQAVKISIDDWNGNFFVSKKQILDFVQENFDVKNRKVNGKELEYIEQSVQTIPQVKKSNAYTDNNGNLIIKIDQRKPIFRVYNMQGESYYVDEDGMKFPLSNYFTPKVPIVTGNITERCDSNKTMESVQLQRVFNVVRAVNKNELWKSMIGQYNVNEKVQVEMIPRFGDCTILFGDDKMCEQKLKRLDIFYFDVLRKIGWERYKVINIMYKDQVVCLK